MSGHGGERLGVLWHGRFGEVRLVEVSSVVAWQARQARFGGVWQGVVGFVKSRQAWKPKKI